MTNRKRTVGINIRVTPQEKKRIVRFAKKCRLSVSEYIRQLAEGYTPQQLPGRNCTKFYGNFRSFRMITTQII